MRRPDGTHLLSGPTGALAEREYKVHSDLFSCEALLRQRSKHAKYLSALSLNPLLSRQRSTIKSSRVAGKGCVPPEGILPALLSAEKPSPGISDGRLSMFR
jgi:hypothetical protein